MGPQSEGLQAYVNHYSHFANRLRTRDEFKAEEHDKQSVMNRISDQRTTVLLATDAVSYTFKSRPTSRQVIIECLAHAQQDGFWGLCSYDGQARPLIKEEMTLELRAK